ncbi:MAG: Hsp20/alpha crystallin family protein [Candidatus Methanofastidiosum methylothiophilum]|uniref:Hsp20/alpha crystallin family protein n=1 Tax=Candidatus Methanofastidiosum methylothiophilum TaxID=1705564 RepID=A0A150J1A0_9EURY|nr:MAG: Hsp20/alpha crystallin family protein [Candidatus Methanofastidiosum methylthiophilus]KYC46536.1 MAG: Hsp20/alpha crystallin family protein [Candidatus Methanofastidiosum methylthiophilus]KYC51012.1 MAG: Hsp20/alpha crystallin family protein [Candidatus Methanofastidiosum methylthiophilus]
MIRRYYIIKETPNNTFRHTYWRVNYCGCNNVEPLIEYRDTKEALFATLDMPCVEKEKIEVISEENCVRIFAPTTKGFCFSKDISLPFLTEPEKVTATFKKGVLLLEIPKKVKHYKVEIK